MHNLPSTSLCAFDFSAMILLRGASAVQSGFPQSLTPGRVARLLWLLTWRAALSLGEVPKSSSQCLFLRVTAPTKGSTH